MKIKGYANFWVANKVYYWRCASGELLFSKKRSRCPRRCCCCILSSAISTVDNRTLLKESDSKATMMVRTVDMTHSLLTKTY